LLYILTFKQRKISDLLSLFRQELCEQLVKRYLARKELNDMKKDVDTGLLQAIESSKTEIKKTLEDMKQFIKIHKKT
jgi:uncharacterized protein YeaC (DUF1315 family)